MSHIFISSLMLPRDLLYRALIDFSSTLCPPEATLADTLAAFTDASTVNMKKHLMKYPSSFVSFRILSLQCEERTVSKVKSFFTQQIGISFYRQDEPLSYYPFRQPQLYHQRLYMCRPCQNIVVTVLLPEPLGLTKTRTIGFLSDIFFLSVGCCYIRLFPLLIIHCNRFFYKRLHG